MAKGVGEPDQSSPVFYAIYQRLVPPLDHTGSGSFSSSFKIEKIYHGVKMPSPSSTRLPVGNKDFTNATVVIIGAGISGRLIIPD